VEGGRITVTARREGSQLWLSVRDTGVGLAAAAGSQGTGFGTRQVRERLATLYGGQASLVLSPALDAEGGTLAELSLPLHTEAAA
jgi:signal transduction histidine kinase